MTWRDMVRRETWQDETSLLCERYSMIQDERISQVYAPAAHARLPSERAVEASTMEQGNASAGGCIVSGLVAARQSGSLPTTDGMGHRLMKPALSSVAIPLAIPEWPCFGLGAGDKEMAVVERCFDGNHKTRRSQPVSQSASACQEKGGCTEQPHWEYASLFFSSLPPKHCSCSFDICTSQARHWCVSFRGVRIKRIPFPSVCC
jgi:hypothetical protein